MPYRRLKDHAKIIEYVAQYLRGWDIKTESRIQLNEGAYVKLDLLAVKQDLKTALAIEAKISSENKAISGGVGQLLFYREVLNIESKFDNVLLALAAPGAIIEYRVTREGTIKLPAPHYVLPISKEALNFAKRHDVGIFTVYENGVVRLSTSFPLSLRLFIKDLESTTE